MTTRAAIELTALDVFATRVVESNSYAVGNLLHRTTSGWALADNATAGRGADAVVVAASPTEFWIVTSASEVIPWAQHGLTGDADGYCWLGSSGAAVNADPSGPGVVVVQVVFKVLGSDHMIVFPQQWFGI